MTTLTTGSLATETLTDVLLALESLTNRLTVLTLNAAAYPEQSPRLRVLLGDLDDALGRCERDLDTHGGGEGECFVGGDGGRREVWRCPKAV